MSDEIKARAIALLERLMAFDTESDKSNLPLIDFVQDYLRGEGVPALRAPNAAGDKAALLATIGRPSREGSSSPVILTSSRSKARIGPATLSSCAALRAASTGAARAT